MCHRAPKQGIQYAILKHDLGRGRRGRGWWSCERQGEVKATEEGEGGGGGGGGMGGKGEGEGHDSGWVFALSTQV